MSLTTQMLIAEFNNLKSRNLDPSVELTTPRDIPPERMSPAQLIAAFTQLVSSKQDELGVFGNGLRLISFQYNRNKNKTENELQNMLSNPVNTLNTRFDELVGNQAEYDRVLAALDNDEKRLFKAFGAKVMGKELDIQVEIPDMGDPFSVWLDRGIEKLREAEAEQDEARKVEIQTEAQYMMYGALFLLSEKRGFDVRKEINDEIPELGKQEQEKEKKQEEAPKPQENEPQNEPQNEQQNEPQGEPQNEAENEPVQYPGMTAEESDRQRRYEKMLAEFEVLPDGSKLSGGEHLREDGEIVDREGTPISPDTLDMTPEERKVAYESYQREQEKKKARRQNNATINRELADQYRAQKERGTFLANYGKNGAEFNETGISKAELDAIIEKMKTYDPIQRALQKTPMFSLFAKDLLKKEPKRNAGDYTEIVNNLCDAYDTGFYAHRAIEEQAEDFQAGVIDPGKSETGDPNARKRLEDEVTAQRDQLRQIITALEADGTGTNALGFKRWKNSTEYTTAFNKLKELASQYEEALKGDEVDFDKLPDVHQRAEMFKVVKAYLDDKKSVRVTTSGQLRVQCFLDALNILSPSDSLNRYYREINRARNALGGAEHEAGNVTHYSSGAEADLALAMQNIAREEGADALPEQARARLNLAPSNSNQHHADYVDTIVSRYTGSTVGAAIREGRKLLLSRHHPPEHPIDLSVKDNALVFKRLYMLEKLARVSPQGLYTKADAAVCNREMSLMTVQENEAMAGFCENIARAQLAENGESYTNRFMNELASGQEDSNTCMNWLIKSPISVEESICRRQAKMLWDENFKKLREGDADALNKLDSRLSGEIREQYEIIKREYEDAPCLADAGTHPERQSRILSEFNNWLTEWSKDMTAPAGAEYSQPTFKGSTIGALSAALRKQITAQHKEGQPVNLATPENQRTLKQLLVLEKMCIASPEGVYTQVSGEQCLAEVEKLTEMETEAIRKLGEALNQGENANQRNYFIDDMKSYNRKDLVIGKANEYDGGWIMSYEYRLPAKKLWNENFKKLCAGDPNALTTFTARVDPDVKEEYDSILEEYRQNAPGLAEAGAHPENAGSALGHFKNWLNDFVNDPQTRPGDKNYDAELQPERQSNGPAAGM